MARFSPRLAAGVGVLSVFLLLGGSGAAAAIADPGGSHSGRSDRGSSSDRDGGQSRGGSRRGDDDRGDAGNGNGRKDANDGSRRDDGDNGSRRGGSNNGSGRGAPNGSARSDAANGRGGGSDGAARAGGDGSQVRVGSGRDVTQELLPSDPSGSSDPSSSGLPSGSGNLGTPRDGLDAPRATVGNGRSPGIQSGDPQPRWQAPAPEPASVPPPPPPLPPVAPSWADRVSTPPAMPTQMGVAQTADLTDGLWGIAGLLLIPAAGAALGYRQARAAQAAERLTRV